MMSCTLYAVPRGHRPPAARTLLHTHGAREPAGRCTGLTRTWSPRVEPRSAHRMHPDHVIEVEGIRKSYGRTVAVADVSFTVRRGEIFGLIGPNGAGKTTTMESVAGLRAPDAGRIAVLGLDPLRDRRALQLRIGVQLQEAQLQKRIKVWEAVAFWRSLYPAPADGDALLGQLGLDEKRDAWFMTLSGGQKQRLFIALALVNDPEVVFLDELTTGLDPQARRAIWDLVRDIRKPRQDGRADHPSDGGSGAALRPGGDPRPGPHHRHRHPGRARRAPLPPADGRRRDRLRGRGRPFSNPPERDLGPERGTAARGSTAGAPSSPTSSGPSPSTRCRSRSSAPCCRLWRTSS